MAEVLALPDDDRREFARELLVKLAIDTDVLEAWYDEAEQRWPTARVILIGKTTCLRHG